MYPLAPNIHKLAYNFRQPQTSLVENTGFRQIKCLVGESSLNTGLRLTEGPPGPQWNGRQQPCSHTRLLPGSLETRRPEVRGLAFL